MPEMPVILRGLATSNEGDVYDLLFTTSPLGLKKVLRSYPPGHRGSHSTINDIKHQKDVLTKLIVTQPNTKTSKLRKTTTSCEPENTNNSLFT